MVDRRRERKAETSDDRKNGSRGSHLYSCMSKSGIPSSPR